MTSILPAEPTRVTVTSATREIVSQLGYQETFAVSQICAAIDARYTIERKRRQHMVVARTLDGMVRDGTLQVVSAKPGDRKLFKRMPA